MKVMLKKVGEPAKVIDVENNMAEFERLVGGETLLLPFKQEIGFFCSKAEQFRGERPNFQFLLKRDESVCGDVVFVGCGKEDIRDLTDDEISKIKRKFNKGEE